MDPAMDPMAGGGGAPMDPAMAMDPAAMGMPPEEGGGEPDPEATPGSSNVVGSPDDTVTRGEADVVMDIAERAIAAVGKGKTKDQQQAASEVELEKKRNEADAAGMPDITGAAGQGGPMGDLGGSMDPGAFSGPLGGGGGQQ